MVTISVMNQKGGVGKSTSTRNIATFFAMQGYKTLMIDIDAQANLSQISNMPDNVENTVLNVFRSIMPGIYNVSENLFIVPSSLKFAAVENEIKNHENPDMFIFNFVSSIAAEYDICFIDCPPAVNVITANALTASQWIIIPMEASKLAFNGLEMMLGVIAMVREELNPDLSILGAFFNKFKEKTVVARDVLAQMKEKGIDIALFNSRIRQFEDFKKAEMINQSIFEFAPSSLAAADYRNLGHEIIAKLKENQSIK